MIYFTADLHFYHDNIIKHADRPFSSAEQMNSILIRNWNRKIGTSDEVYILGDVTMKGAAYASQVLSQLTGRKYLIKGNHDRFVEQEGFDRTIFTWCKEYYELVYKSQLFVLFHYPIEEWVGFFRGSIHLHGHQHHNADYNYGNLEKSIRRFDVGVDANDMMPISIEDILTFFSMSDDVQCNASTE